MLITDGLEKFLNAVHQLGYTANFYPMKTTGLGITGSLQGKPALSMEKDCKNHKKKTFVCCG